MATAAASDLPPARWVAVSSKGRVVNPAPVGVVWGARQEGEVLELCRERWPPPVPRLLFHNAPNSLLRLE